MAKKVWWTLAWNISQVVSDILKPTDYLILQEQKDSMYADLIKEGKKEPVMSEGKSGRVTNNPCDANCHDSHCPILQNNAVIRRT